MIELSDVGNAENAAAALEYLTELGSKACPAKGLKGPPSKVEPNDKIEKYKTRSGETV